MFLALLFVFSCVACAGGASDSAQTTEKNDTTAVDTTAVDTTAPAIPDIYYEPDDLPDLDFNGRTVRIISGGSENNKFSYFETTFTIEDLTGNFLNDSIYNRELYVEDRLGVEIENIKVIKGLDKEIETLFASDDDTYDAIIAANPFVSNLAIENYLIDLYTVDHIDLEKPWWSQDFNEKSELFDNLYMTTGSLFPSLIRSTFAVYYNKTLAANYSSSYPDLADIYSVVDSGNWTFDKFVEIGGDIYEDTNGNSRRDLEDVFGIAYDAYTPMNALWSGFDISIFSRTDDGWFEFDVNTDKLYTAFDKMYRMLFETVGSIKAFMGNAPDEIYGCDISDVPFANGTNLFLVERIGRAELEGLRNMKDDYGILPYPKYDSNQKDYYSFSDTSFAAVAIPKMNTDPSVVGAVLEAMASYSYRETMPLYLDTVLKGQYMSDGASRRMVDIIVEGIKFDSAWIFVETLANKYPEAFMREIFDDNYSYSTIHEKKKKNAELAIKIYKAQVQAQ